ncbi:MAG: transcriptional repressor [Chloroflexaceae bacterium]|nr:transcriptional repressor [Chloroflexaceae bacterium]
MEPHPDEFGQQVSHFQEVLKRAGVKQTHQRLEIFREVMQTVEHPDAETVYRGVRQRIPTISLDTVYRTLMLFTDLGLISSLKTSHERMRFDANMHAHHHFVCTECGMIRDFSSPEFDALAIPDAVRAFGSTVQAHVEFRGLCWHCLEKKQHGT